MWGAQLETGSTATAFQNVGTDKVSVFSGLTKASDAGNGTVYETSAAADANNGAFLLRAPSGGLSNYQTTLRGTLVGQTTPSPYVAPITNVVTVLGSLGEDINIARINGTVFSTSTDLGTGTFLSYPLYVGRRAGSTLPFNGRLFQLVIRGEATDSVTVGNAERWVGQLTGVAL